MMTIVEAMRDRNLFAPWFKKCETWSAWISFLCALFALPMTADQATLYQRCTGRTEPPATPFQEVWLAIGRRGGKSFILALIAVVLATFHDYRRYLAPGERGTVLVIAADKKQARIILRYIRALLTKVPMLAQMVERETATAFDLDNGVSIEIGTASFRSTRGYTIVAALLDEIAFWRTDDESANPDTEILAAIRPGMATIPNAMLLCASSPYARRGALWDAHRRHFAKDTPVLVWQADTRTMNPTVPQSVIDEAYERDPASAAAEYGAQFRVDVESLLTREVVEAAIVNDRYELPPVAGVHYFGFVDPSGGSSDAMTLAVAHMDRATRRVVLDAVRERRPPFSPDAVTREFAELLRTYHVHKITGDHYGGEWPKERFRVHGISYERADKPKSDIYGAMLPLLNGGRAELLDHPRLTAQLIGLERKTSRAGRDTIDHAPGQHDDVANSVAGVLVTADAKKPMKISPEVLARASQPTSYSRQRPWLRSDGLMGMRIRT